ncbi:MAG: amidohydrolase family protein [Rhodothalassiaceae bacterium]
MRVCAILALLGLLSGPVAAADTIIHAGRLIAVPGEPATSEQSILIRDGRIAELRDGYARPVDEWGDATVIDLTDKTVLPGLIDSHTHITSELGPGNKLDAVTLEDAAVALRAVDYAGRTLQAGFTTIRNTGAKAEVILPLRDAIAAGHVMGPRIVAAGGGISGTGGHADAHGYRLDFLEMLSNPTTCNGPDDCRRAVRQLVKQGSDLIKITSTGGVLSETAAGTGQQMFNDEIVAIVETARMLGRKVAAHAHGKEGIEAALRAGVDSIEHGTFADEETFELYKQADAYLVPTMLAGQTVVEMASQSNTFMPKPIKDKALAVGPTMRAMVKGAHEAGVKIAFGTDSGVSKHGDNARELLLMAKAGMPNEAILISATINAADLLGLSNTTGTLEPGKAADIIAVDGDPLEDLQVMLDVPFVMARGQVAKHRD